MASKSPKSKFVRADPNNLPNVDLFMLIEYMKWVGLKSTDKHNKAELKEIKAMMSSHDSYLDNAVGYVELKRESKTCIVKAQVVPEHGVGSKLCRVSAEIDEENEKVVNATCEECPASAGGCKHSLVFLFWLQKRSSEPDGDQSVESYWTKPLGNIEEEYVLAKDIFPSKKKFKRDARDPEVLKRFIEECKKRPECQDSFIFRHCVPDSET